MGTDPGCSDAMRDEQISGLTGEAAKEQHQLDSHHRLCCLRATGAMSGAL